MKKALCILFTLCLLISSFVPVSADSRDFLTRLINDWQGDSDYVKIVENWFLENRNMTEDQMWEYLSDTDYIIPIKEVTFEDTKGQPCEDAVALLGKLGIVTGREEGKYFPDASLTRAEMVTILLRVFGQEEYNGTFKFDDVTDAHWAFKNIMMAYGMGIVNGTSETTFSPDLALTYEQAVKMLVSAFGYDTDAVSLGGWPEGYIAQAEKMGFLGTTKPENTAGEINRGTMAQLLYNAIDTKEFAVDHEDPYREKIYFFNSEESDSISNKTYIRNTDGTPMAESVAPWDTLSVIKSKFDGKIISAARQQYVGGDWEYVRDSYKWIQNEKVRGMYYTLPSYTINPEQLYQKAFDYGINTAICNLNPSDSYKDYASFDEQLILTAEQKKKYGDDTHLFIKINFGSGFNNNTAYGAFVSGNETIYTSTPCPLSEEYWERQLIQRFALCALHPAVDGVVLDVEMYGADSSTYMGPCFCDHCYNMFLKERGYTENKKLENEISTARKETVSAQGVMEEYVWWQEKAIIRMLQKYERALHEINPDLIIANMPGYDTLNGITRGFGTPKMPMLILDEATYSGIFLTPAQHYQDFKDSGYPSRTVSGLWSDPVPPNEFDKKMGEGAYLTDGYWVYAGQYFLENAEYTFSGGDERTPEAYFEALKRGTKIIDDYLEKGIEPKVEEYEILKYSVKRVNGKPAESDWKNAPYTQDYHFYRTPRPEPKLIGTRAQMLWDGKNLYAKVRCDDKEMADLPEPKKGGRDVWSWEDEDVAELFWSYVDEVNGMHIAISRGGNIYDSFVCAIGVQKTAFDYDIEYEYSEDADGWTMLMKIPLSTDGIKYPKEGETIKLLLGRARTKESEKGNWCWATVESSYLSHIGLWGDVTLE